ncbi:MAG: hypothetical protein HY883_07060 [Deltaproteobacteria bacterium]|nr:hypothetical protein [Deltaproteobacteria bacterium]
MGKFPKKRTIAIALTGKTAVFVRAEISGGTEVLKDLKTIALPSAGGEGLVDSFKAALEEFPGAQDINLSIPDTMAKTSVLTFEELPRDKNESDSLIKWKSAGSVFLKPEECSIDYQLLTEGEKKKVLSVVVKKDIIEGYEGIFSRLGKRVTRVNIHSFDIFNLFSEKKGAKGDFSLVVRFKDYFSFLAFKDGILDFYRCKEAEDETGLFSEVLASFAFYTGRFPEARIEKVYILGADGLSAKLREALETDVESVRADEFLRAGGGVNPISIAGADPLDLLSAVGALVVP